MPQLEKAMHGINIGGWLVIEKWMTPSIFKGTQAVDEFTLSQTALGRRRIQNHRATFMREEDFRWLVKNNIAIIRVPIGHWLLENEEPFVSGKEHLVWLMEMAEEYSVQVLLCLHGAPRSQNGKDHSGKQGEAGWFLDSAHQRTTLKMLRNIAREFGNHPQLWGIEVLNEPAVGWSIKKLLTLRRFYISCFNQLAPHLLPRVKIVYSDGFRPWIMSWIMKVTADPEYRERVVMDVHLYQTFGAHQSRRSIASHIALPKKRIHWLGLLTSPRAMIIGEWSRVLPRKLFTNHKPKERAEILQQFYDVQQQSYQRTLGHFYWSYKTESKGSWNYRSLVETGQADLKINHRQ